jgi:hypothetical protein
LRFLEPVVGFTAGTNPLVKVGTELIGPLNSTSAVPVRHLGEDAASAL